MSLKEWIEVSQLVVNLVVVGAVPFIVWLIIRAFKEQQEALKFKNEYLEAVSVKDWREQLQALKDEYRDRMNQMALSLKKTFGESVVEVVREIGDEHSLAHINKIIDANQKRIAETSDSKQIKAMNEKMYSDIRDELLFAGHPRKVFMQLPEPIKDDMQRGMQGFLLEFVVDEKVRQQFLKGQE